MLLNGNFTSPTFSCHFDYWKDSLQPLASDMLVIWLFSSPWSLCIRSVLTSIWKGTNHLYINLKNMFLLFVMSVSLTIDGHK